MSEQYFKECPKCAGAGFIQPYTPSDWFEQKPCPVCNGIGFVEVPDPCKELLEWLFGEVEFDLNVTTKKCTNAMTEPVKLKYLWQCQVLNDVLETIQGKYQDFYGERYEPESEDSHD